MTKRAESRYMPIMFSIGYDRDVLYERIDRRVDIMMRQGLEDEAAMLRDMGYGRELNSMQGIGYKELFAYFDGEYTLGEAVELIKRNSRRYAKRQLTWFRRDGRITELDSARAAQEAIRITENALRM